MNTEGLTPKQRNGQLEYLANTAGAKTKQQRLDLAEDIRRIEKVAKEQLGGNVMVYKGGSQKKHTNIQGSDLDVKLSVPRPLTWEDRLLLEKGLNNEFGKNNIITTYFVQRILPH